jgi:hypothetical protein
MTTLPFVSDSHSRTLGGAKTDHPLTKSCKHTTLRCGLALLGNPDHSRWRWPVAITALGPPASAHLTDIERLGL